MGQRPHSLPDWAIPLVPATVSVRQAGDSYQGTGSALADAFFPDRIHGLPPLWMRQYFFDRACLRASMSSAWSATIRLQAGIETKFGKSYCPFLNISKDP